MEIDNIDKLSFSAHRHAENPCNTGRLGAFNGYAKITGPCGTTMEFWLWVDQGQKIKDVSFATDGCYASLAAGSMATCLAQGKTLEKVQAITQQGVLDALGGLPEDHRHCALLAANTLAAACEDYWKNRHTGGK